MSHVWKNSVRYGVLPCLLLLVFLAQTHCPVIHRTCALWSDHPRWWQFFTCSFLSGNRVHLGFNVLGMTVLYSQFSRSVRFPVILILFILFSAITAVLYFWFCMPAHAWLVGASGGIYTLLGFFSWFLRCDRICFLGFRKLSAPIIPAISTLLFAEYLAARFWLPVVAWQMHVIGFLVGISGALVLHGVYAGVNRLAAEVPSLSCTLAVAAIQWISLQLRRLRNLSGIPVSRPVTE
ncbi:MAG: rhomboid family intramembrane serine protease [Kiritimatiellales bacterium]